ncbi:MAG: NAD(P)-dependent oxidoreductase [Patescibacteria group bacterium]|jgi:D-lactate dehydrogenase
MKIVFFETTPAEETFFREKLPNHELTFHPDKLTHETAHYATEAEIISIFVFSPLKADLLARFPKLHTIVTRSTGIDHIDAAYCAEHKISILNVPHYGVNSVAEHAFALMLALSRKIVPSVELTKKGSFSNEGLTGFDLCDKTLGIIGLGNIGNRVASIANAFKMKVLVYSRTQKPLPNVTFVSLDELLRTSDIITIHTPLTPETTHLLHENNMRFIKKGALLINTARGPIIDTQALVQTLQNGILAGAALDVLEEEQSIKEERMVLTAEYIDLSSAKTLLLDHVLRDMPNVIITPHNAFNTIEALEEINSITVDNITSASRIS